MVSIRQSRMLRGLTVRDAAQQAYINPGALRRYESGDRQLPVQVAQALGIIYDVRWWQFYPDYYPNGLPGAN